MAGEQGAASNQEIEAMRSCLKYEDWTDNAELPEGWKSRPASSTATHYMDRGGQVFRSALQAARFLEEHAELFTLEDREKMMKLTRRREAKVKEEPEWRSDSSLPAGWSSRLAGRRKLIRDGGGKVYRSVRAALETVLTRGDQGDQGDTLRAALEREGWIRLDTLEDWLYKQQSAYVFHFITPTGEK